MRVGLLLAVLSFCAGSMGARHAQSQPTTSRTVSLPEGAELSRILAKMSSPKKAYALGVELFEAKRYADAEQAWQRAYALDGGPTLLVAIADTRQRRRDVPGAVAVLERYLVERPNAPDKASIEARIATLLQSPARLVVRSIEPGHAILLDGVPVPDRTPATLDVEPGTHTVIVVGDGQQVGEETVQVDYGDVRELDFSRETKSTVIVEESEETVEQTKRERQKEDQTVRRAVISTAAIASAALVTGAALGSAALQKERQYRDDPSASTADRGNRIALFADLSFGIAALSAITSLTLFLTHRNKRKRERETALFRIETRGAGATATLRF